MTIEQIYSPILDVNIRKNLKKSEIWGQAYTEKEIVEVSLSPIYLYSIKFEGTEPVQVLNVKKLN